jgi:hypothetical protein
METKGRILLVILLILFLTASPISYSSAGNSAIPSKINTPQKNDALIEKSSSDY